MITTIEKVNKVELWAGDVVYVTKVILISGRISAGKTTLADMLVEKLKPHYRYTFKKSFAYALKACARKYLNWDGRKDAKGRKLLQGLGTLGREYDKNVWVEHLINDIYADYIPPEIVVIDDWRFPNELERMSANFDIVTIRISRPNGEVIDKDISEVALKETDVYDIRVDNSGTLEDLSKDADDIVQIIFNK